MQQFAKSIQFISQIRGEAMTQSNFLLYKLSVHEDCARDHACVRLKLRAKFTLFLNLRNICVSLLQ